MIWKYGRESGREIGHGLVWEHCRGPWRVGGIWSGACCCFCQEHSLPPLSLEALPSLSFSNGISAQKFYLMFKSQAPYGAPPDCTHFTVVGTAGPLFILLPDLPGLPSRGNSLTSECKQRQKFLFVPTEACGFAELTGSCPGYSEVCTRRGWRSGV